MQVAVIVVVSFVCVLLTILCLVRLCVRMKCELCDLAGADLETGGGESDEYDDTSHDDETEIRHQRHNDEDDEDNDAYDDIVGVDNHLDYHRAGQKRFGLMRSAGGVENRTFHLHDEEDDLDIVDDLDSYNGEGETEESHELENGNVVRRQSVEGADPDETERGAIEESLL